jgi:hypothetical protein
MNNFISCHSKTEHTGQQHELGHIFVGILRTNCCLTLNVVQELQVLVCVKFYIGAGTIKLFTAVIYGFS